MKKTVAVVGLGYVGLPLALVARNKGWNVVGFDVDAKKVQKITAGVAPFEDEFVATQLKDNPLEASTDPICIVDAEVVVVAVPTPVTDDHIPDLTPLTSSLESILPHLQDGQLLSVESTINPGVMTEVVLPIIKKRPELTIHIVHCPERVNPGDAKWSVANIPRVIGGFTKEATKKGKDFYESILDAKVKEMDSVMEAEAVKILENTFRDINIAFVNEMAKSFDKLGIDIKNVIEGASTKPFAFMPHYPGNGVGGHCISVDPYYMIEKARQVGFDHEFLKLAREINNSMPEFTVALLDRAKEKLELSEPITVALLGLSYKKDIDDIRESPALDMKKILEARSDVSLRVFDPHVPRMSTVDSLDAALTDADVVMLATNHSNLVEALTPENLKQYGIVCVIDGKNALNADGIAEAGMLYLGVGRTREAK
ncbi:MAG: nucleotide sugar dehydrogenase [Candidatus Andersenbacteria bacterium]|nr:nucleotide sugar dehydrogenase [Candidatus Andersenbacteria bacterium]